MRKKKRIGILGLGARTTEYYRGQIESLSTNADVVFHAMDFETLNANLPNGFVKLEPLLLEGLRSLSACDVAIIPNITLHETLDRLPVDVLPVTIAHGVHETLHAVTAAKTDSIALLGSSYTSTSSYWAAALSYHRVEQKPLASETIERVDEFRRKVYQGVETATDVANFHARVNTLRQTTPVILACTELSLFKPQYLDGLFDCADIQIQAAIDKVSSRSSAD